MGKGTEWTVSPERNGLRPHEQNGKQTERDNTNHQKVRQSTVLARIALDHDNVSR